MIQDKLERSVKLTMDFYIWFLETIIVGEGTRPTENPYPEYYLSHTKQVIQLDLRIIGQNFARI